MRDRGTSATPALPIDAKEAAIVAHTFTNRWVETVKAGPVRIEVQKHVEAALPQFTATMNKLSRRER